MPFISAGDGDLKSTFITDAWLIDQFVGNRLWGVGGNGFGELGINLTSNRSSPVQTVTGGVSWSKLSASLHIASIKTDGTLWIWGNNNSGQIGDNTISNKSSPVQTITFDTNWKQVSAGYNNTLAIKTNGTLWCWGSNSFGQIGDNTTVAKSSPVQTISGGNNWKQVASGNNISAAVKTDGTLWVWGFSGSGGLGNDVGFDRKSSPIQTIAGGTNWNFVTCSFQASCAAIKTDGTLWMWGDNTDGVLGDNSNTNRSSPVQTVTFAKTWSQVSCGRYHTAAIKTDGTLWTWGRNSYGQLGDNALTHRSSPIQTISGGSNWKQVSCGQSHTTAIKTDGSLWSWGFNTAGRLGDGTIVHRSSPVQIVSGGNTWKQVVGGRDCTIAVTYGD